MAGRSPRSPKGRSPRSPSYNAHSEEQSDVEREANESRHSYNTRYNSSQTSSNVSSHDDSLPDDNSDQDKSFVRSSPLSEQKLRSRHTKSTLTSSPGELYPDLSKEFGDGPNQQLKDTKTLSGKESLKGVKDLKTNPGKCKHMYPELPQDAQDKDQQDENTSSNSNTFLKAVLLILITLILGIFLRPYMSVVGSSDSERSTFEKYVSGIEDLQKHFPQQSSRLWRTLKSSAKHVLDASDPEYPVIILMASPTQNFQLTKCIAQKVASVFESSQGRSSPRTGVLDISQYQHLEDAQQKETLDNEMTRAFSHGGAKSFIMINLQALAPEAALILHSFCDNDNAPHKDVLILMTLHFTAGELQAEGQTDISEDDVEGFLRRLWERGLVRDKVGALLSRVANNVVIVAEETSEKYLRICNK